VAPDFTLPSANSGEVTLSALAAEQPVVLVFYRAFW
jgi:peroxiredoxin